LPLGGDIVQRLQRFGTYGRLKQIALRKVAHNIASDSALVSDLRKAFQQLDTAGTGELASRQVTCMYASQDSSSNAMHAAGYCRQRLVCNKAGAILYASYTDA